jgi:hypothetical protein
LASNDFVPLKIALFSLIILIGDKSVYKILKIPLPEDLDFSKWVQLDRLPKYIPTENEITQLISGCNQKTSTML